MSLNVSTYESSLQTKLNATTGSTSTTDFLLLAKALDALNTGTVISVATTGDLPTASSNTGRLYFVTADSLIYYSNGSSWVGIPSSASIIASIVDAAPTTLDTLNELAAALGDDPNFATTVTNALAEKAPLASPSFTGSAVISSNSSSDALRITQTGSGNALVVEDSTNPDSTPFVIDSSGTVTNGATTPKSSRISSASITPGIQQVGSTNNTSNIGVFGFNTNPGLLIAKSNGTEAAPTAVASGNYIARISGAGFDGTNYTEAGSIRLEVDGTPGTDDMPGRFVFSTTADGASATTERVRISANGITKFSYGVQEAKVAVAASDIDMALGNYFTKTISGSTTFTVSNAGSSGTVSSFVLDLTNGGSATVTWMSGTKWAGGTAPTLTSSGRDVLGFFTHDGGTTWNGFVLGKALA